MTNPSLSKRGDAFAVPLQAPKPFPPGDVNVIRCRPPLAAAVCWAIMGTAIFPPSAAGEDWSSPFEPSGYDSADLESPNIGDESRVAQYAGADEGPYLYQPAPAPDFTPRPQPRQPAQGPHEHCNNPQCQYCYPEYWTWQFLPEGLLYKSYLAGPQEPRFASAWLHERDKGWFWDVSLGARIGVWRYGTTNSVRPQGWQLDVEGGALPRLNMDNQEDLEAVNFRFGVPLTWSRGPWQMKFGYYHLSAHVGDEYLISHPAFNRVNYVRDSVIFGVGYFLTNDVRIYAEAANAFHHSVADPWEVQFGFEYSPAISTGLRGLPFFAANVQLFEEQDFGGALNTMVGWQWRGARSQRLLRFGLQYFNGKSSQFAFFDEHEELLGLGLWLDQ